MRHSVEDGVRPLHGHGFISVCRGGVIHQVVSFDYEDPDEHYASLIHSPDNYEREMQKLISSMQELLNEERVLINGNRVEQCVRTASLDFRGMSTLPCLVFVILFEGSFKRGRNVYESHFGRGTAEYDYEVYWMLPPEAKVEDVRTRASYDLVTENLLILWARKGDEYGEREKITFELKMQHPEAPGVPRSSAPASGSCSDLGKVEKLPLWGTRISR